jgi:chaperone modulatory protein CbpM
MSDAKLPVSPGQVLEEATGLTLLELSRACGVEPDEVQVWVIEGVLEPEGRSPHDWRFAGSALRRARLAMRLARDLEVNTAGVALALDLLDEIDALKARLQQAGVLSA